MDSIDQFIITLVLILRLRNHGNGILSLAKVNASIVVRFTYESPCDITFEKLKACKYLQHCIPDKLSEQFVLTVTSYATVCLLYRFDAIETLTKV